MTTPLPPISHPSLLSEITKDNPGAIVLLAGTGKNPTISQSCQITVNPNYFLIKRIN